MFGFGNMMKEFEDDPFFGDMPSGFGRSGFPSLMGSNSNAKNNDRMEVGNPFQMFGNFEKMMKGMETNMGKMRNDPNVHSFSSSSVMTYHNDGKSKPKVYQASSSTRRAPGDIRETHRSLRDSERGIEKMAIGQHIGNKGKTVEKRRTNGKQIEERREYHQMDEEHLPAFEEEWKRKTSSFKNLGFDYKDHRSVGQNKQRQRGLPQPERSHNHEKQVRISDERPTGPGRRGRGY